ncbi:hypothetical protein [Methylocaldum sp.]|uniref:hypothetical protein n=1 Tax=Methylocaldum sp. TaxID=1969727 RepID=UPI002D758DBD|nr:hypothetical protein [Methylocaldum sp.]HYE38040.1 hypothetical protein [Methylocaldum sp.]
MKMNKTAKVLSALLLTGAFGVSGSAIAAENAAGVAEHFGLTVKTAKEAHEAAKAGDKDGCLSGIKQSIQHYKELTGAAAGKELQDTIKVVKEAKGECESGNTTKGAELLGQAVPVLEKLQKR